MAEYIGEGQEKKKIQGSIGEGRGISWKSSYYKLQQANQHQHTSSTQ